MHIFRKLLCGAAMLPASLFAQEAADSTAADWEKELDLNEVVVVARRPVVRQHDGKLTYLVKNDPYAKGLDGVAILDRIPRVSVSNGSVSVAGKGNVRYIIDGVLMELDASAMAMRLRNLQADNIEKIELLTSPPSRYAVEPDAVYISIITRNESLGTRGSVYGSLNQGEKLREYASGSISHTTRRVDMSLDASLSNYYTTNDKDITYQFADYARSSQSVTKTHIFETGLNALLRYKFSPAMSMGVIANYNFSSESGSGSNLTDYSGLLSSSRSSTTSRPNNALTVTGFYDWTFGAKGELMQLTYNYFMRHSPTSSAIDTYYSDDSRSYLLTEDGAADYRFHSAKADFKLPYSWAQLEVGAAYTDILNSSDNLMQGDDRAGSLFSADENAFDYTERIAAAYVSGSRSLGSGFSARAGLRYEYTWTRGSQISTAQTLRDSYGHLFPSLNVSWSNSGIGSFNASYSMGMGRPNLWELNPFRYYSTTDEYASGNPGLKPTINNNAEINYYGLGGLYAVVYTSFASDAVGYIRRIDDSGVASTVPYNCLSTNKTGMYASYRRNLFDRWELKGGAEVFHTVSSSDTPDYGLPSMSAWSGKLELSTDIMLNRAKTLILSARFTHFFPWQQNMVSYESFQLFNASLRYSMLRGRLNLTLKANDIFGWNKTRSSERYADYVVRQSFNAHTSYVLAGVSLRLGRDKVSSVWRDPKETNSSRTK